MSEKAALLMIEDDEAYVDLVRAYLGFPEPVGFAATIESAATLAEGLKKLREKRYAAVLVDLGLPDARGLESVTAALKVAGDAPVLVCTNSLDDELSLDAMRRGAQDFLAKTDADSRWLSRAIRHAIERKGAAAREAAAMRRFALLNAEIAERRRMDELKDQWIAVLSHELKTPLTVIKGAVLDMSDCGADPLTERQRTLLGMARRNADRIATLVGNLLDLSRLESGMARIERRPFDASAAVRAAAADGDHEARERGLTIAAEIAPDAPPVIGDPDLFAQLVGNLAGNALRFAKSCVLLRAERAEDGAFELSVIDDGTGIPEEKRKLLFTRFFQLERRGSSDGYRGTGLGLSICKEIVGLHRGTIGVDGARGGGTVFRVRLPAAAPDALRRPARAAAPRPIGTKPKLVLVDDEPDFVRMLEHWLKPHYEVSSFFRSAGIADRIKELSPDLVVLDVHMAEESGFGVCRRLRSTPETAGIPVVFLSGSKSNEDMRQHAELGGTRYLMKPIGRRELLTSLAEELPAG